MQENTPEQSEKNQTQASFTTPTNADRYPKGETNLPL